MTTATPKPRSPELDALRARVADLLAGERLSLVLAAALERAKLERIVARSRTRPSGPFAQVSRDDLASHAAASFVAGDESAFDVVRELDRATDNERTIVVSMEPEQVTERFVTPAALRIKRHGAQLVWAVVRDDRLDSALVRDVVERYVAAQREGESANGEVTTAAQSAPADISFVERERAQLVAEIGRREAALKQEVARCRELEAQIARLEADLMQRASTAPTSDTAVTRRLEKRIAHLEREQQQADETRAKLVELENENDQLKRTVTSLRAALATAQAPKEPVSAAATSNHHALPPATSAAVMAAIGMPLVEPPRKRSTSETRHKGERVAVLVDVANVAGAARLLHERSVDYHRLLADCVGGRTLVEARAYVIDKGQPGVESFTTSLRAGGYKVQLKRPKTFADGSMKADWDLAIAVDALSLAERVDVVVLVSGDGDYVPLVAGLKRRNIIVEAAAFDARAALELKRAVDGFSALGEGVLL